MNLKTKRHGSRKPFAFFYLDFAFGAIPSSYFRIPKRDETLLSASRRSVLNEGRMECACASHAATYLSRRFDPLLAAFERIPVNLSCCQASAGNRFRALDAAVRQGSDVDSTVASIVGYRFSMLAWKHCQSGSSMTPTTTNLSMNSIV